MRAVAILVTAILVVFAGGLLVLSQAAAAPSPEHVLFEARSFAESHSAVFRATEQLSLPSGSAALVWHRDVSGEAVAPDGTDMLATPPEGGAAVEYRTVPGTAGVWIRPSTGAAWAHQSGYLAVETTVRSGPAGPLTALADRLADGAVIGPLLRGAHAPHRHGRAVRQIDLTFNPGLAGGVSSITGELTVDAGNRPTALTAHLRYHDATVDVTYALAWRPPITLVPPA